MKVMLLIIAAMMLVMFICLVLYSNTLLRYAMILATLIAMFFGKKLRKRVKFGVVLAIIGLYLLCYKIEAGFCLYDVLHIKK